MVKQISDNEIYLLIKYTRSVLWRVVKRLSYKEDARCLTVREKKLVTYLSFSGSASWQHGTWLHQRDSWPCTRTHPHQSPVYSQSSMCHQAAWSSEGHPCWFHCWNTITTVMIMTYIWQQHVNEMWWKCQMDIFIFQIWINHGFSRSDSFHCLSEIYHIKWKINVQLSVRRVLWRCKYLYHVHIKD